MQFQTDETSLLGSSQRGSCILGRIDRRSAKPDQPIRISSNRIVDHGVFNRTLNGGHDGQIDTRRIHLTQQFCTGRISLSVQPDTGTGNMG
jgi:hypothetical protein